MVAPVAFKMLLEEFPDLALAVPPEALSFRQLSFVYGLESLPVVPGRRMTSGHPADPPEVDSSAAR